MSAENETVLGDELEQQTIAVCDPRRGCPALLHAVKRLERETFAPLACSVNLAKSPNSQQRARAAERRRPPRPPPRCSPRPSVAAAASRRTSAPAARSSP